MGKKYIVQIASTLPGGAHYATGSGTSPDKAHATRHATKEAADAMRRYMQVLLGPQYRVTIIEEEGR